MSVYVRFAPSPTGYLHVGNIRTALVNWLFAKAKGGRFLLRMDDTDSERSKPEFESAIEEDLRWLGLTWESFARQMDRMERYDAARQKLIASGRLYPCYETQEELDIKRKMLSGRGLPPIYDRAALSLTDAQKKELEAKGKKPHYRFKLDDSTDIVWQDMVRGEVRFRGGHVSDPVLIREDGVPLYTLSSVVDDGEMNITHIMRGEDHVSNTAVQIQIFEALGFAVPTFAHLALLKTKEGELSKRTGGGDIRSMRAAGIEAMAINSLLARIGTSDPVEPFTSLSDLAQQFDINKFGRAPANFDMEELERLNGKILHHLSIEDIRARGYGDIDEHFWNSVRGNISSLSDLKEWWGIVHGTVAAAPAGDDAGFLKQSATALPPEPWNDQTWDAWIKTIGAASGRKGKALFMPIRKALTGMEHGPEMKKILPLLGYEKTKQRLIA